MRSTISLRSVAMSYALGAAWCIVLMSAAFLLLSPMDAVYAGIGIESPEVATVGTTALAIAVATVVTGALWSAARRLSRVRQEVASHA